MTDRKMLGMKINLKASALDDRQKWSFYDLFEKHKEAFHLCN